MARVSPIPGVNRNGTSTVGQLRALSTEITPMFARREYARLTGKTFSGKRDMYDALGYPRSLTFQDYWEEYQRNGLAERIVESYPRATWSGGATIVDRPLTGPVDTADTDESTEFETATRELFHRLDIYNSLLQADILAGIGHFALIVIGAPGDVSTPLDKLPNGADSIVYLTPYPESVVTVKSTVTDMANERFGMPEFYEVEIEDGTLKTIHYTRTIHVAEGRLTDPVMGKPRLRSCWNYLIDLAKIVGGGSEAAWKRMDPGLHIDIDPEIEMDDDEEELLSEEVDDFTHGSRRTLRTRGTKVTPLFANVASFSTNVDSVTQLISAASAIPHRILTGSERGQLASTQDRNNWNDRVKARRRSFADPILFGFINLLISLGALPEPENFMQTRWPDAEAMDEAQKARAISGLAAANQAQYLAERKPIITSNEMRDQILGLGPLPDPEPLPTGEEDETAPPIDKRFRDEPL